ncbi:MAG: molybdenum cofactor biosynthesis protein B [bacterium]
MAGASHKEHKEKAEKRIVCGVITVSDTRTKETDGSGQLILQMLSEAGHDPQTYHIAPDDPSRILPLLDSLLGTPEIGAIIINGGTGVARRDVTFDVVERKLEKVLPGFGELFRSLSFEEIGSAALLSRAVAGSVGDTVVFSVPGSKGAVRLAMERLILPEMPHIVFELRK